MRNGMIFNFCVAIIFLQVKLYNRYIICNHPVLYEYVYSNYPDNYPCQEIDASAINKEIGNTEIWAKIKSNTF
jgi:hypothetical protein